MCSILRAWAAGRLPHSKATVAKEPNRNCSAGWRGFNVESEVVSGRNNEGVESPSSFMGSGHLNIPAIPPRPPSSVRTTAAIITSVRIGADAKQTEGSIVAFADNEPIKIPTVIAPIDFFILFLLRFVFALHRMRCIFIIAGSSIQKDP